MVKPQSALVGMPTTLAEVVGMLGCYDRIVITGSLQPWCYPQSITRYPYEQGIGIVD